MKISSTSKRLKDIMQERNLKQVDILTLAKPYCDKYDIKLSKVDLSQYVSGKVEPGQSKLFILAEALNVSEAWLMGLDVPMKRVASSNIDAELYSIGRDLETFNKRIAFYTEFRNVLKALGYSLSTNWKTASDGNTIDLLENADYQIEVPHAVIKEIMNSSKSFIEFNLENLFCDYPKQERDKTYDNMSDEEFENLFSEELNAAHDDKNATPEERKISNSIMEDDSEWT